MKLNLDRYNQRVKQAGKEVLQDIKSQADSMGIEHRADSPSKGSSVAAMKEKFQMRDDAVSMIQFKMRRSLIVGPHKGAGKGRGGIKGSTWLDKYNVPKKTNPKSFGKMGTGGRVEKPFINKTLESEKGVDKIATIAAEELGDAIVNKMMVK